MSSHKILLINGPNLNLLGTREPHIYGSTTLQQLNSAIIARASQNNINITCFQSNSEGDIVSRIHKAGEDGVAGRIINPAAYTHTSVAIRDALLGVDIPFVEIHISNPHKRETYRHHSYLKDKASAVICGMGIYGYFAALDWWAWTLAGKQII
ncbi:3-dehydroquinate dehydratase type II [Penicillium brevicompactum]|uniref:Catabolic 3-dehydroquinase n=1 Tax=Penicillium brevicompactum TaxID=5074 RepID=A0A9W9UA47_PENBR|nr:3-dehydroquinate dehydratase type II [Penicillium brevicompactum]